MIEALKSYACEKFKDRDVSHGLGHFIKVLNNIREIIDLLEGDELEAFNAIEGARKITEAAAYCHDFWDHKYFTDEETMDACKAEVRDILSEYMDDEDINIVFDIIDNVSFSKEKRGETKDLGQYNILLWIVQGADRREAIGHIGLERCRQYGSHAYPNMTEEESVARIVEHCHEKLLHIKDTYTHCQAAKSLMEEDHQIIEEFVKNSM